MSVEKTTPYIVEVTGRMASGKSAVCQVLRLRGVEVIELDQVARDAQSPGGGAYEAILEEFGVLRKSLDASGVIARNALRRLITGADGDENLRILEDITMTAMQADFDQHIASLDTEEHPFVVIERAALKTGRSIEPDCIVGVVQPSPLTEYQRAIRRADASGQPVQRRALLHLLRNQKTVPEIEAESHIIVHNVRNKEWLRGISRTLYGLYLNSPAYRKDIHESDAPLPLIKL